VKAAFADKQFRDEVKLGAVNSINWARVLAQIIYYFSSYLQVTSSDTATFRKISFAVPTGNFGDILAGYYAKRMGLPIDKLIVCTNDNDILHRFFETGTYERQPCKQTVAPSMDISVSSNFERYLFYIAGEDPFTLRSWMTVFESTNSLSLSPPLHARSREDFVSYATCEAEILQTMRDTYLQTGYLVCPHTATAVAAVHKLKIPQSSVVVLATAHPSKFSDAVTSALHPTPVPDPPQDIAALFDLPQRVTERPASQQAVQALIRSKLFHGSSYVLIATATAGALAAIIVGLFILRTSRRLR
jgi:threonine synthase